MLEKASPCGASRPLWFLFLLLVWCAPLPTVAAQVKSPVIKHAAGQAVRPMIDVDFDVGQLDDKGLPLPLPPGSARGEADMEKISPRARAEKLLAESHKAPAIVRPKPTAVGQAATPLGSATGRTLHPKVEAEKRSLVPEIGTQFVAFPPAAPPTKKKLKVQYLGPVPPDVTIAAGPNQLLVASNLTIDTFDKLGNPLGQPKPLSQFFQPLGTFQSSSWQVFDPVTHFDEYLKRFWLIAGAVNNSTSQSLVLVALSRGPDATDGWSMFSLDMTIDGTAPGGNACDYPKLGYDTRAIYISCNMFNFPLGSAPPFQYAKVRVLAKSQFVNHTCCSWNDVIFSSMTVQPAIMHRARDADGEYLIDAAGEQGGSGDSLDVYHIPDPIGNPGQVEWTSVNVGGYYTPPGAPQPNGPLLDTGDARLQFAIWQDGNLSSGQNSLCTSANTSNACAIFYEFNVSGFPNVSIVNNWALQEENVAFYYPAAEENSNGDKIIVYTLSIGGPPGGGGPGALYVAIPNANTCTGCAVGLPQGLGGLSSVPGASGPYANYAGTTRNRWGDYLGAAADPDGHGIWVGGEGYASPTEWAIAVGAFYGIYQPDLTVSPTSINFSDLKGGSSWERDVTVTSSGNADLILQSMDIKGSTDFSVSSNACKVGHANPAAGALEPKHTCVVKVAFKPTAGGSKSASLDICSNVRLCLAPTSVALSFAGPSISKINPDSGPLTGGQVSVTGEGLSNSLQFEFGGSAATGVSCSSPTTCTMSAPAHAAGKVDVLAKDASVSTAPPGTQFTYQAPAIIKITPAVGPIGGGQTVQLTGVGLTTAMEVKFGRTSATGVDCASDTSCGVTAPAGKGAVHVSATVAGHTSTETAADLYSYAVFPTVSSVTPNSGPVTGSVPVTVSGTGFSTQAGATDFKFGSLEATSINCSSSTQCTMNAPARSASAGYLDAGVTATVAEHTSTERVLFSFGALSSPHRPGPPGAAGAGAPGGLPSEPPAAAPSLLKSEPNAIGGLACTYQVGDSTLVRNTKKAACPPTAAAPAGAAPAAATRAAAVPATAAVTPAGSAALVSSQPNTIGGLACSYQLGSSTFVRNTRKAACPPTSTPPSSVKSEPSTPASTTAAHPTGGSATLVSSRPNASGGLACTYREGSTTFTRNTKKTECPPTSTAPTSSVTKTPQSKAPSPAIAGPGEAVLIKSEEVQGKLECTYRRGNTTFTRTTQKSQCPAIEK